MTDVDFVNLALNNLGAQQIAALERTDSASAAMAIPVYQHTLEVLLGSHSWRFATSRIPLSQIADVAPADTGYAYQYALPNGAFRIVRTSTRNDDWIVYRDAESGYRRLYSNSRTVWADIVQMSDPSLFPPYFQAAFVAALTAGLALPITRRADVKQVMDAAARAAVAEAITHDWNEQPWPEMDDGDTLTNAKYGIGNGTAVEFE